MTSIGPIPSVLLASIIGGEGLVLTILTFLGNRPSPYKLVPKPELNQGKGSTLSGTTPMVIALFLAAAFVACFTIAFIIHFLHGQDLSATLIWMWSVLAFMFVLFVMAIKGGEKSWDGFVRSFGVFTDTSENWGAEAFVTSVNLFYGFIFLQLFSLLWYIVDGVHDSADVLTFWTAPENYTRTADQVTIAVDYHWFIRLILSIATLAMAIGGFGGSLTRHRTGPFHFIIFFAYTCMLSVCISMIMLYFYSSTDFGLDKGLKEVNGARFSIFVAPVFGCFLLYFLFTKNSSMSTYPSFEPVVDK